MRDEDDQYLPVYPPGALLFVDDGHAAEGAGELTGDALETSMDVEFSVDVIQGESPDMPRAENDDSLMALGIGGSPSSPPPDAPTTTPHKPSTDIQPQHTTVATMLD